MARADCSVGTQRLPDVGREQLFHADLSVIQYPTDRLEGGNRGSSQHGPASQRGQDLRIRIAAFFGDIDAVAAPENMIQSV